MQQLSWLGRCLDLRQMRVVISMQPPNAGSSGTACLHACRHARMPLLRIRNACCQDMHTNTFK